MAARRSAEASASSANLPPAGDRLAYTRSPGWTPAPSPAASTTPRPPDPGRTAGQSPGKPPPRNPASHRPTPAPWTLTSACPAAGAGAGRLLSSTLSIPPSSSASATRMAVPSSPCAPAAHRSRSAPATALGSARRQRRYRHLTGLRAGRRPALLSEADLLPVPSGVPEGGDDGELVAVPLGGRAELDVECLEKEPPGSGEACDACRIILVNTSLLLYVLVVENETNGACGASRPPGTIGTWRTQMPDRLADHSPAQTPM